MTHIYPNTSRCWRKINVTQGKNFVPALNPKSLTLFEDIKKILECGENARESTLDAWFAYLMVEDQLSSDIIREARTRFAEYVACIAFDNEPNVRSALRAAQNWLNAAGEAFGFEMVHPEPNTPKSTAHMPSRPSSAPPSAPVHQTPTLPFRYTGDARTSDVSRPTTRAATPSAKKAAPPRPTGKPLTNDEQVRALNRARTLNLSSDLFTDVLARNPKFLDVAHVLLQRILETRENQAYRLNALQNEIARCHCYEGMPSGVANERAKDWISERLQAAGKQARRKRSKQEARAER